MQISGNNLVGIAEVSSILGVSSATIQNWIKQRYIKPIDNNRSLFNDKEINKLKEDLSNGTLDKLSSRANKKTATKTFIPDEYLENKDDLCKIEKIIDYIQQENIELESSLFLLSLNLLFKKGILKELDLEKIISLELNDIISNKQIRKEIKNWIATAGNIRRQSSYEELLKMGIPQSEDILGLFYQSLLLEGKKSQGGSYYTPKNIVNDISNNIKNNFTKILDPCCGSGQFLLTLADKVNNPECLFGFDIDDMAVRIARMNLLIKFPDIDFNPHIYNKNTLTEIGNYNLFDNSNEQLENFDLIATNPPWGAHLSSKENNLLKEIYPEIKSMESFSYFLKKSIDLLNDGGYLSFILPESILSVKTHKDIRKYILDNTKIEKIYYLNRVFKNVFTPVIRMDLSKNKKNNYQIVINKNNDSYNLSQERILNNEDYIFNIHIKKDDYDILDKVYNTPHTTLKNNADWALGIVSGNNSKYIKSEKEKEHEAVFKGKDINKFFLNTENNYIHFEPEKFQQVAPVSKYRAKEKLIYRFISKYLIFAYDDKQKLTLNSANIVIPKIDNYPIKVMLALFNSSLYQFIFQKKFSSIKVLRSHIEELPLPLWGEEVFNEIIKLVNKIIKNKKIDSDFDKLDKLILEQFNLEENQINYILNYK